MHELIIVKLVFSPTKLALFVIMVERGGNGFFLGRTGSLLAAEAFS